MTLSTITLGAIIKAMGTTIAALSPEVFTGLAPKFRRLGSGAEFAAGGATLRAWAPQVPSNGAFRVFEIAAAGVRGEPGQHDSTGFLARRMVTVSVAYPAKLVALLGTAIEDALESIMDADAVVIHDALSSWANVAGAGHHGNRVEVQAPERADTVWFQDLAVEVLYNQAQTIT